jgi:hypothetical protein
MIKKIKTFFLVIFNVILLTIIVTVVFYSLKHAEILAQTDKYPIKFTTDYSYTIEPIKIAKREKAQEKEIYGLYLTSYSASRPEKVDEIINFMKGSQLNAVVIDIKDYSGQISYDSNIPLVNELKTDRDTIKDVPALIKKLHDNNIYAIARQTVFQDPELSNKKPEWAVKNSATGGVWRDNKGLAWLDPTIKDNWKYNLDIAKEAIDLGFDEVNFDYVRFPSDGQMALMKFANLANTTRAAVMKNFFAYLYNNLKDEPAYISGDLFGFTTERTDDMQIGQVIEDAALYFDYVCPMVYPSHYPSGYLNFTNPAAHPYDVVKIALTKGEESLSVVKNVRAKIRPWLQNFDMGAVYTPEMIDFQIKAAKEAGAYGYTLWNARNVYGYAPKQ